MCEVRLGPSVVEARAKCEVRSAMCEGRVASGDLGQCENSGLPNIKTFTNIFRALTEGIPLSSGEGLGVRPSPLTFFTLTF
jgi:hypothetical protein